MIILGPFQLRLFYGSVILWGSYCHVASTLRESIAGFVLTSISAGCLAPALLQLLLRDGRADEGSAQGNASTLPAQLSTAHSNVGFLFTIFLFWLSESSLSKSGSSITNESI